MGRPRNVSTEQILDSSMNLFWKQGYDNTSFDQIIKRTGTSRYALYQEFGGKEKLFITVLDYYTELVIRERMKVMNSSDSSIHDIKDFFQKLVTEIVKNEMNLGCLICNSTVYEAKHYPLINDKTNRVLEEMQGVFKKIIKREWKNGLLKKKALDEDLDALLLAQLISINVMSQRKDTFELLEHMLKGVNILINSYMD